MLFLRTLGRLSLENGGRPIAGAAAQRARVAILAVLAAEAERGVTRDRLLALFWPESDTEHARGSLKQALYALRRDVAEQELTIGTNELRLNPAVIGSDVETFEAALNAGDDELAVRSYGGAFLDGIHLRDVPDFEHWLDGQQQRLAALHRAALERLAYKADRTGDARAAVQWWRKLAIADPLSAPTTIGLMNALMKAGDAPGALRVGDHHAAAVERELEIAPDLTVIELAARIRATAPVYEGNGSRRSDSRAVVLDENPVAADLPTTASPQVQRRRMVMPIASAFASIGALILIGLAFRAGTPPLAGERVIVAPFANLTGDPALDGIGLVAADWITQGIVRTGFVDVVSSLDAFRSGQVLDTANASRSGITPAIALARELKVRALVSGSFHRDNDGIAFQAQIVDAESGAVLRVVDGVTGVPTALHPALETLLQRVLGSLGTLLDDRLANWTRGTRPPPDYEAYRLFSEGMQEFLRATGLPAGAARLQGHIVAEEKFKAAAARDTMFALPLIWVIWTRSNTARDETEALEQVARVRPRLLPVEQHMADYVLARRDGGGGWEKAYQAAQKVVAYAPDSDWQYKYARAANETGRFKVAVEVLSQLDPDRGWMKEWPSYWITFTNALHMLGQCKREADVLDQAARRFPNDGFRVKRSVAYLCAGNMSRALALADSMLEKNEFNWGFLPELRWHGHPAVADSIAESIVDRILTPGSTMFDLQKRRGRLGLTNYLIEAGQLDSARAVARQLVSDPGEFSTSSDLFYLLPFIALLQNNPAEFERELARIRKLEFSLGSMSMAEFAMRRGEREQALDLLLDGITTAPMIYLHRYPGLIPLRNDPRLKQASIVINALQCDLPNGPAGL